MPARSAAALVVSAAVALCVVVASLAGCATRVRETGAASDVSSRLAARPVVATVAVATAPTAGGQLAPADRADAADALYGALLAGRPELTVWHPSVVGGLAGADTLAALATQYGRLGRLRPEDVRGLAAALDGCGFLALGRLTTDRIGSNALRQDTMNPEARAAGQPEHDSAWAATVNVQRDVTVTLELFDLATGESVWRAEASSRAKRLYEYDASSVADVSGMQQRLAGDDQTGYLSRGGEALRAPDLIDLLRQAFTGLAARLPVGGAAG